MDKYTLRIGIFNSNPVKTELEAITTIPRVTIESKEADHCTPNSYNLADILIVDTNMEPDIIDTIFATKAHYTRVILVVVDNHWDRVVEPHRFFDIWNINNEIILFRIEAFVNRFRDIMDAEVTNKQLNALIDSLPDLIWFKDINGAHIKVNDAFCKTVNKTKEQIKDRGHCYIWDLDPSEYEQGEYVCMETEDIVIEDQQTHLFDEIVKIGNEMRQLKTYKSAIIGRNGETIGTAGFAHDVTDIWNTHEEFKTLINNLPYPIMIVDKDFAFVSSNKPFQELFHYSEENHEGFDIHNFGSKFFNEDVAVAEQQTTTLRVCMDTGINRKYFDIQKKAIHDVFKQLTGYFYIFEDETAGHEYEQKLKALSQTDELTQIPNRQGIRSFYDMNLDRILKKNHTYAVFLLDLDYFKQYNDTYGHVEGDRVLRTFAQILTKVRDGNDLFVSRYGGEEFMVVAVNKTAQECEEIAASIMQNLADTAIPHSGSTVKDTVTVSIGIAYFNTLQDYQIAQSIEDADTALYHAKNTGRNRYTLNILQ